MIEPIIVHQECFNTACTAVEGKERFDHSLAMLFVSLAYHIARCTSLDIGFPLRIEIKLSKDIWDYCLGAEVYNNCTEGESEHEEAETEALPPIPPLVSL